MTNLIRQAWLIGIATGQPTPKLMAQSTKHHCLERGSGRVGVLLMWHKAHRTTRDVSFRRWPRLPSPPFYKSPSCHLPLRGYCLASADGSFKPPMRSCTCGRFAILMKQPKYPGQAYSTPTPWHQHSTRTNTIMRYHQLRLARGVGWCGKVERALSSYAMQLLFLLESVQSPA
ncbi:hypothetical protein B0I35DRAFT_88651 [Stachybotrys elegans]|uniref:Uncharacterized protein n=1 Tax=Stachybotrys elegans TaxID=80388 RepID=A0A8K0WM20_9HYPO|nr:hypothetical protein B0I35DRAFT_88651 [Stachybotrys elegans]